MHCLLIPQRHSEANDIVFQISPFRFCDAQYCLTVCIQFRMEEAAVRIQNVISQVQPKNRLIKRHRFSTVSYINYMPDHYTFSFHLVFLCLYYILRPYEFQSCSSNPLTEYSVHDNIYTEQT